MNASEINDFAAIAAQVVGKVDVIAPDAKPNPWFCKDIYRKKDLQWAGYIGPIGTHRQVLAFGLNLEFTPAWRRAFPKLSRNLPYFSRLLFEHKDLEWHWMGRPGVIAKNPPIRFLSPPMLTYQVDLAGWIVELGNILDRKKMWSTSTPMRPQIQIMRQVGLPDQPGNNALIRQNIQQTVNDLRPLAVFLGK